MASPSTGDPITPTSWRAFRAMLAPWRVKQDGVGIGAFVLDYACLIALESISILARPLLVRTASAIAASLLISRLFILAHDACHGSLFTRPWANKLIGRLGFLPSLTPYSLWEVGHNVIHHGFTNLKGRDWVWTPLTKQEYDKLSPLRRFLERRYRSAAGLGLYYAVELWWKRMIMPDSAHLPPKRTIFKKDLALTLAFALIELTTLLLIAKAANRNPYLVILFGMVIPFACWSQTVGLVVYQQHTHPAIAWFNKRSEWSANQPQLRSAVHVLFPGPLNKLLHNTMEHTAHHLDAGVPLHNLPGAQAELENEFPEDILVQPWSIAFFRNCLNTCKLYDYDAHCWLDFNGRVTFTVPSVRRAP